MWFAKMPEESSDESSNVAFNPDQSQEAEELVGHLDELEEQVSVCMF